MNDKIIVRNLDVKKYSIIEYFYQPKTDLDYTVCENCGRLISNICVIKDDEETYNVGLDCISTIMKYDNLTLHEMEMLKIKKYLNNLKKFRADLIKKNRSIKPLCKYDKNDKSISIFHNGRKFGYITEYLFNKLKLDKLNMEFESEV